MIEVRFRPFTTWPQAETRDRTRGLFSASWSSTLALLDVELRALDATDVVIETGHSKRDIRNDGWPRSDARVPPMPGVILSFGSKHGPLRYLTDAFSQGGYQRGSGATGGTWMPGWQANLRAIALGLEALRAVDRYGVSRRGEQYRGWNELPSGIPMGPPMTIEEAASLLEHHAEMSERPLADWTPDHEKTLYRLAAKRTHPDLGDDGGDPDAFRKVETAHQILKDYVR